MPFRRRAFREPDGWCVEYPKWGEGPISDPELWQDLSLASHTVRDRVLDVS